MGPISYPVDALLYLGMWLNLTTTHRQTWLFSSTSTYHSTDLVTARGVAHLVVHGTSGSTSYETIPPVPLETSGGVLSTVDIMVQRLTTRLRCVVLDNIEQFMHGLSVIKTLLFYLDKIISSDVILSILCILCMHDFSVCLFSPAFRGCQNPINGLFV